MRHWLSDFPTEQVSWSVHSNMISSPPLIRFAHPMAFQWYLRRLGAPVDRYLRQNGLPALCEEPDVFVPVMRVWAFFNQEARAEDPFLGWHVGKFVGDHALNAGLLQKIEQAPTLLSAIRKLCSLVRSEGTDIDIGIVERQEDVLFYTHYWGQKEARGYHVSQAYQISVFLDLVRFFLGRDWIPAQIGLEASRIPPELENRFPGTRFLARQPFGFIAIPRKLLHRAACSTISKDNAGGDLAFNEYFDYVETLCEMIKAYLSEGYVSERTAAGLMDTSVRTLTRKLALHGITYGKLLDDVRFEVAKKQLGGTDRRIIDVARSSGFKDQANFTRMFRRISGITPGQFRRLIQNEHTELGPS
jgi:AraC-like DNA-binding protein